jgi:NAD(P)-dependent dehydrogenase (short-subunit alcohol dehydrogenase family)
MAMELSLDGKVAVVTGGGSGLGFAMAQAMVEAGAQVVVVGRRESVLREACDRIGAGASWVAADISRTEDVDRVLKTHVYGAYAVTRGFVPAMIRRGVSV